MLVEESSYITSVGMNTTAALACQGQGVCRSHTEAVNKLQLMAEKGLAYQRLEKDLGRGVCFVLGIDLPETYWTKLLAKSTPQSRQILTHVRSRVGSLAADHATLREEVVEAKRKQFIQFEAGMQLARNELFGPTI
ncbi:hypothetical protein KVT40_002350 [Elsinoe batatas]|uniref:Uncharacterized protein n=1 Tax=Elsinoe batatas TaxID=2601811 RepID=A0A8K0L6B1_9PEZI|nr:hypothetical protein KVT40_002350 [Elsinoe batatas]